jgi:hypothetical protein
MKHRFTVTGNLDAPVAVTVAAYLDCEHYIYLHKSLTDSLEIMGVKGRVITVRQSWKWFGLRLGHIKDCEYIPPCEFKISNVLPSPRWFPSIHHFISIYTYLAYIENKKTDSTDFSFDVELDMPFWLFPLRGFMQRLIEKMHDQQNAEDMALIKRREKLFGRGNITPYLAEHHFMYHKDDYLKHFGQAGRSVPA